MSGKLASVSYQIRSSNTQYKIETHMREPAQKRFPSAYSSHQVLNHGWKVVLLFVSVTIPAKFPKEQSVGCEHCRAGSPPQSAFAMLPLDLPLVHVSRGGKQMKKLGTAMCVAAS